MTGIPSLFRGNPRRDPDNTDAFAAFFVVLIVATAIALVAFVAYEVIA